MSETTKPTEVPFSWMLRSRIATKSTLDTLFRFFGARRVLPSLYYIRPLIMGANFLDVRSTFDRIHSWEDWIESWRALGEKREIYGSLADKEGRTITARDNYLYASAAYNMAQFPLYDEVERKRDLYKSCSRCYRRAAVHMRPPAEEVEIPFADHMLPGYLRIPDRETAAPLLILIPGADSSKEEMHFFANALIERGVATLTYDGPGMGETWDKLSMVIEYERVGQALIEFAKKERRIDPDRIGLFGISYGGNLALRIAAYENSLGAVISLSGPYDPSSYADFVIPVIQEQVKHFLRDESDEAYRVWARSFSIRGLVGKIRSPLLVIGGGEDVLIPGADAKNIFEEAHCKKKLIYFEDGNHICAEYAYDLIPKIEEWLLGIRFLKGRHA